MKLFNTIKNLFSAKSEKAIEKAVTKKTTRARKPKALDLYKFVSTDKKRYFMNGVYHEDGFKIATNGSILAMVKSDYEEKLEKVILHKSLIPIEGNYPNYKRVIPDLTKMKETAFDFHRAKDSMKEIEGIIKIAKKQNSDLPCIYKMPNGSILSYENLQKTIHFLECYPDSKMYTNEDNQKAIAFVSGKTDSYEALLLVMPMCSDIENGVSYLGRFGFADKGRTEKEIISACKQQDILKRKEYGTMTEKDIQFLNDVQKYMAIFKKVA